MATFFFTKCIGPKVHKLSGLLTLQHQVDTHVLVGEGGESSLPKSEPPDPATLAVGIWRAWRQPGGGQPLSILVAPLQGLVTNRRSILPLKTPSDTLRFILY